MHAPTGAFARARLLPRAAVVGTAAAAAVLLLAVPALAHITITPDSVPAGTAAVLTFHVPNEEAHANTTQVDVQIPTIHPIAQLLVKPIPGWKISVKTVALAKPVVTDDGSFTQAVSEVIWSGGQIVPGQFQDFTVSADPLPQGVSQVAFKAIQTYSNGDVVRWIDLSQPGQPEPEHPAPILVLTTAAHAKTVATSGASTSAGSGSDGTARGLGIAGLVAGLAALALATRRRRSPAGVGVGASARDDRPGTAAARPAPDPAPAAKKAPAPAVKKATPQRNAPRRRG